MPSLYRKLYSTLTDADTETTGGTVDSVVKNAPENFFRLLATRTCSKIADRLSSPKTTLAWLLQSLGAPTIFIGLLVPLRESGALLPQLFLSNYLKRYRLRKWAWSLGSLIEGAAIAGCAVVALTLEGSAAGIAIVGLIAIFSLARGISSISAKDVLGKTIPKSKRGQLTGWAGSASGVLTIAAAGILLFQDGGEGSTRQYALYLSAAALLWWAAAFVNTRIVEPDSETEKPKNLWGGLGDQLTLLKKDAAFRNFLIVRALAVGSGLSTPYIISLAHDRLGGAAFWLGIFIIAEGLAAMLTAPLWGKWADRSSRSVLRAAMLAVGLLLTAVIVYVLTFQNTSYSHIVLPTILFLLGAAHTGIRVGRKTYVVDMAEGNKRTDYVAVGNTLIGLLLIAVGLLTGIASLISVELALGFFALSAMAGAAYGTKLPSVSEPSVS